MAKAKTAPVSDSAEPVAPESSAPEPVDSAPEPHYDVVVEINHSRHRVVLPEGFYRQRTIAPAGFPLGSYEHVSEDENGKWVYRRM